MSPFVTRRHLMRSVPAIGMAAAFASAARAQSYPTRPIRLIVPFAPGGGVDAVGRIIAEPLGAALGQPVVVENRAGAGGGVGLDAMAKSPPDGYTLAMAAPGPLTAGPAVRQTPYDPLTLGHVTMVVRSPLLLVSRKGLPAQNLAEFVALVKREPDRIRFASGGVGTGTHLAGELVNLRLGVRMVHVPYRGTGPALADLVAENVDIYFSDASVWPMVQQGQLRLLAVSSSTPWATSPQTPSVGSVVPDFDTANWYGVTAPPGTPDAIRAQLAGEIAKIVVRPEIAEMLRRIGFEPAPMPPAQFAAFVRTELETWRSVVRAANIRAD